MIRAGIPYILPEVYQEAGVPILKAPCILDLEDHQFGGLGFRGLGFRGLGFRV